MKLKSLKALHRTAWDIFSKHIRQKAAGFNDYARCYTCDAPYLWKDLQAGHYLHDWLDFDEQNVHPQCQQCNYFKRGNTQEYARRLVRDYGPKILDTLNDRRNKQRQQYIKYTRVQLEEVIQKYS